MIIFMLQVVSILGDKIPWDLISLDVDCKCACVSMCPSARQKSVH